MIYITGDTHSDVKRFSTSAFPEQKEMTKDDYLIILGDFGLVWDKEESEYEKYWLDWLENKPFTTLFIDGNHENFDRLNKYKTENWKDGKINRIRQSVIHLKRGYVFNIDGTKIFAFGGARSHDIDDGILKPGDPRIKEWNKHNYMGYRSKRFRVLRESWWPQEMPDKKERERGLANLEKNDFKVDFILTHDMPTSTLTLYCALYAGFQAKPDILEDYLDDIRSKTEYKRWFCGHYHDERNITPQEAVLYYQIVRIA